MTMQLVQGSLEPDLRVELVDGAGEPVPLSQADSVQVRAEQGGTELFLRTLGGGTDNGVVLYRWQEGDTATPGRVWVDVLVTWPGGRPQWFRSVDVVDIEPL